MSQIISLALQAKLYTTTNAYIDNKKKLTILAFKTQKYKDTTAALYGAFLKMRGAASENDKQTIRADALVKLALKELE